MHIGFTGTQEGMNNFQKNEVSLILLYHHYTPHISGVIGKATLEAHHGDCIGADAEFEELAKKYGYTTYAHPASDTGSKRAYCKSDTILPAKPALKRNKDIVNAVDIMIATPKENHEVLRSGTWATIRYAKKRGWLIHVIYPG